MRHLLITILLVVASLVLAAPAASAHVLDVHHPHTDDLIHSGWVGGFASFSPHGSGLPVACESSTRGAARIWTPWNVDVNGCTHF